MCTISQKLAIVVAGILATHTLIMGNLQHFTMYISFGLFAVTSILVHHKVKFVPKGELRYLVNRGVGGGVDYTPP